MILCFCVCMFYFLAFYSLFLDPEGGSQKATLVLVVVVVVIISVKNKACRAQ